MKSLDGFHPVICSACKNREGFNISLFIVSMASNDAVEMDSIKKKIAEYDVQDFGIYNTGKRDIILAAICNKCRSDHVIWDYCGDCEWVKKQIETGK